ncbi:Zn-ribbon domain-containing OB-fold protein [Parasphingorhabdus sp.]|uniref:Zn-ribbon domain-containing OB-fold protein n=1 Tax=Parasphingorhabdus sp. TaxID=2709688 RepID=UPI003A90EBD0
MNAQPIADNLFTADMGALVGARNKETGHIFFPLPLNPNDDIESIPLATRGTVWTYTVQRFPPKPPYIGPTDPEKFKPYVVAYVSLPGQTMVESRLTGIEPEDVKIGMEVEFTVIPLDPDAPPEEQLLIHAFKPVEGE